MKREYIKRAQYLDKIKPYIGKDIIKVIIGQRRVGKSYMLYQIMDYIEETEESVTFIYINKELHEFDDLDSFEDCISYIKDKAGDSSKVCVFIDEIQEIKKFERALRSLQAEGRYDIYCTGSNSKNHT